MMKNRNLIYIPVFMVCICSIFIIRNVYGAPQGAMEANGFIAPNTEIPLNITNNQVDSFWESINTTYQNITELGSPGIGYVKFANNESHLYALLATTKDIGWFSVEFEPDPSVCMENLNDGWSFYIDGSSGTVEAKDVNFIGTKIPADDSNQDLSFEVTNSNDQVLIEVVRPFNTNDADGYDIIYENGSSILIQFASKNDHFGSHEKYYLFVTDTPINNSIVPPPVDMPIDLNQVKFTLITILPFGVGGFLILHMIRRVFWAPIRHDFHRITKPRDDLPPTFMQRWNQLRFKEDQDQSVFNFPPQK